MNGGDWLIAALVAAVGALTVAATVLLHFEGLSRLDRYGGTGEPCRRDVLLGVFGVLALHVAQIVIYGTVFWWVSQWPGGGHIDKAADIGFLSAVYMSALNYTTLGLGGGLSPVGPIRMLVAIESLAGLLMITWSASFTYHRLSRHFGRPGDDR